ncbi:MAG TPA: SDR family oxidoreductase [Methylomirabilota bacterium]|nr:SDR family oxidoreductase [Methylomirabilota bacterium]
MSSGSADLQLNGKVVVVTGAARGIGAAIARAFGSAKCKVLVADRMKRADGRAKAEAVAQEITRAGGQAFVMQVDVSDQAQVSRMFQTAEEKFGRVDIYINNAAIMKGGYIWDTDLKNLQEHFDVNVKGSFQCCQTAAKQMIKQGTGGKIVIISSIDGMEGNEAEIAYAMSKASLILLMKCMAVELAQHKINVNAIAPGWVETEMTVPYLNDALLKEVKRRIPLGDMAKPEQIAGGALFLASHLSSFMTGHVMVMDGGQTINQTIKAGETAVQYST